MTLAGFEPTASYVYDQWCLRPLGYMHLDTQHVKVVYTKSCKQLKYILIVAQSIMMLKLREYLCI